MELFVLKGALKYWTNYLVHCKNHRGFHMLPLLALPALSSLAIPIASSLVLPIANKIINTLGNTVSSVLNNTVNQAKSSVTDILQNPQKTKNKIFF